ncbi:hypothetical protein TWF106_000297 [Orbilia oligospora]|uniref:Uncharacterized protein n=1 Tax=Orbilia oligospora TaxID=2813651 RepID=A0A7C8QUL5_ORBOL|nr:hypothetical protein TWF106_000297 [Orbilia oligospora]
MTTYSFPHCKHADLMNKRREHIKSHTSNERLDLDEVRGTNLEAGLFSNPLPRDISQHLKDIEYTKSWHTIYKTAEETGFIPPRTMLLALKKFGDNRVEELEEKLDAIIRFENHEDKSIKDEYHPKIDLIRWKIKYYQHTLQDGQDMLDTHDDETMYAQTPLALN